MNPATRESRLPPPITDGTPVLASNIPLPPLSSIVYAKFIPVRQHEHQHKAVEFARQRILTRVRRNGRSILNSLLPIVRIGKEEAAFWVFAIHSEVHEHELSARDGGKERKYIPSVDEDELEALVFDGLERQDISHFSPLSLYPCSTECAKLSTPCNSCTHIPPKSTAAPEATTPSSSAPLFPRLPLRTIYGIFVDAVRDRLIDDICNISHHPAKVKGNKTESHTEARRHTSSATRLGTGFLCGRDDTLPSWGSGWEQRAHDRPLIHTALDIYLSPTAIHIRPLPSLTTLVPVPIWCSPSSSSPSTASNPPLPTTLNSLPLTPGTPLILAPYPTPAFYVSTHAATSISSSIRAQFSDALMGLGAPSLPPHRCPGFGRPTSSTPNPKTSPFCTSNATLEPFILVFISLANPQGEPKGITALWPAHLAFIDTSPTRSHLTSLPEMPGAENLLTPPRGPAAQPSTQVSCSISNSPFVRRRSSVHGSIDSFNRTQRAFRALELSSHKRVPGVPIYGTAKNAAGYVENVAREREKERERANQERMRREKEAKEGKSLLTSASTAPNLSSSVAQVTPSSTDSAVTDSSSPKAPAEVSRSGSSWHSVSTNFFAKAAQDSVDHSFYPSPPDWNPVTCNQISGSSKPSMGGNDVVASTSPFSGVQSTPQLQPGTTAPQQTIRDTLDLSNDIDLAMDIGMNDMNIGMNLGDTMGMMDVNMGVNMDATGLMDGGFSNFTDAFTDDDFSYFDTAPAGEGISSVAPDIPRSLHNMDTDEAAVDGWLTDGLAATAETNGVVVPRQLQPITPGSDGIEAPAQDSLLSQPIDTAQISEDDRDLLPPAPDLIPSSPAKTPWSPGNPPTPSLELNASSVSPAGKGIFEPIQFGSRHQAADGKYMGMAGKFAFPNTLPRSSPQLDPTPGSPASTTPEKEEGWKLRYDAITDPRVGVVNRLRGVKRKLPGGAYSSKRMKDSMRDEEWESLYDQQEDVETPESSSSDEEDDIEEQDLGQDRDDAMSSHSHPSRPTTPTPPGLLSTATLLYSHLHHAHLLPLGVPMRPSYSDLVSNNDPPPAPISVPTPVSPAAALGGAAERNRTLELLAQAIAKEAVENEVWAQVWGSSFDVPSASHTSEVRREVSQDDLRRIVDLIAKVDDLHGPLPLSSLLRPSTLTTTSAPQSPAHGYKFQILQLPKFSIGRAGLVHHMLPSALRFWETEGLGPRGGAKDVVAFALFEEGDEKSTLVESWLDRVGRAYSARGFGTHLLGDAGIYERGLVPLQYEAVRRVLPNLMSALPPEPQHIVIYIIAPPSICSSLKSPALRSIIMSQKHVSKLGGQHDFDQDRVLIHLVPDYFITDPYTYPTTRHIGLEYFVNSVYDRLLRPTFRQTSRKFWEVNPAFEDRFQVPAFTLARNTPPHTHLEWDEWPSLNVLDRHTFLQVGYRLSECKKWLLAACIDERGEAHDMAVWSVPNQNDPQALSVNWMVTNVWIFANQFAQRADTEWRVVVSKLGEMRESEVEAWMSYLETVVSAHTGPPIHVSLVCAQDVPLPVLCPIKAAKDFHSNLAVDPTSVFADVSSVTYSATFLHRIPIISIGLLHSSDHPSLVTPMASSEDVDSQLSTRSPFGILPVSTTALICAPNYTDDMMVETLYIHLLYSYKSTKSTLKLTTHELHEDITQNWHDLTTLTRERWRFPQRRQLPFHLAALELMSSVLDPKLLTPDAKGMEYLGG